MRNKKTWNDKEVKEIAWKAFMENTDEEEFYAAYRKNARDEFEKWWNNIQPDIQPPKKEKRAPAKKTTKPKLKRAPAKKAKDDFMAPLVPSEALSAIVGPKPLPRTDVIKKVWGYIKTHGLQDKKNRRMINLDERLMPIFGNKEQVSMFELAKQLSKHLTQTK